MSYQEEEGTKLKRQSSKQAIALAMEGRWEEAVAANKGLLENFPNDVDTYNRLGRAYVELGEYALAKEAYQKAIEMDPYNIIAQKNFDRLSHLGEIKSVPEGGLQKVEPQQFIEEIGKAGVVGLLQLAPPAVLAKTVAGARVNLKVKKTSLTVENSRGEYLGQVGPKVGQRLIKLMDGGNKYSAAIVSATTDAVTVIIREVFQDSSQAGRFSFPPTDTRGFRPYVSGRIGDRILRRELEYEQALPGEPSYTIIGGEEAELLPEENDIDEEDIDSEE